MLNHNTEQTLIDYVLNHPEVDGFEDLLFSTPELLGAVAKDPRLPVSVMERILSEGNSKAHFLVYLAQNPSAPAEIVNALARMALESAGDWLGSYVFLNPLVSEELIRAAVGKYFKAVAQNSSTPTDVLWELYNKLPAKENITFNLSLNRNLPHNMTEVLFKKDLLFSTRTVTLHLLQFSFHIDLLVDVIRNNWLTDQFLKTVLRNPAFTKTAMLSVWDAFNERCFADISYRYPEDVELLKLMLSKCESGDVRQLLRGRLQETIEYKKYPTEWFDEMFPANLK